MRNKNVFRGEISKKNPNEIPPILNTYPSMPKTCSLRYSSFLVADLFCGMVFDLLKLWTPLEEEGLRAATTVIMIFLGSFLTGIGIYDRIGHFAGGGSIIPITGFANSVVSPAMEFNREGIIFGICSRMFLIAGPIVVLGIAASVLVGIIGLFFI